MPFQGKDAEPSQYRDWVKGSGYSRDTGLLVIPIAGPSGTPPLIIQVHSPYGMRVESWEASKKNTPPVIPSPIDTPSGDILLKADITFMQPVIRDQQNQLEYYAEGVYTYVQAEVRDENSNYHTGKYPYAIGGIKPGFDDPDKGFYHTTNATLTNDPNQTTIVDGVVGAQPLTGQVFQTLMSTTSQQFNQSFTCQTTTYFKELFKEDAIA